MEEGRGGFMVTMPCGGRRERKVMRSERGSRRSDGG